MPSESKKKQFPLCSFAFIVQFLPHQLSQYPLWFTLNKISIYLWFTICFEMVQFFIFFLKRSTILIRLWAQIFIFQYPLKSTHHKLLGTQQWHISVLSTHWPTLPAELPTVQGLEHDSVYSGLYLNASSVSYQLCDLGTYYLTFLCLSFFTYKIVLTL